MINYKPVEYQIIPEKAIKTDVLLSTTLFLLLPRSRAGYCIVQYSATDVQPMTISTTRLAEARLITSPYPSRCKVSAFTNHQEIKKRRRKPKEERMKGNSLAYGVGLSIYFTGWARARGQRISSVQDTVSQLKPHADSC